MKNLPTQSIQVTEERVGGRLPCQSILDEVVRGCKERDRLSQHRFYEAFRDDIYQVVLRMVGPNEAPDLLQQSFVQAFRAIDQFASQSHVRTWLYRIAVNECLQFLRRTKRRPALSLDRDPVDHSPGHEFAVENKDLLEQALARLDPDHRAVFVLREVEGLSYAKIAEALEIQEGTVASRLNTARRQLQRILVELGWEP